MRLSSWFMVSDYLPLNLKHKKVLVCKLVQMNTSESKKKPLIRYKKEAFWTFLSNITR